MIIVTGAAGFIGSCLVEQLNREGFNNLILADDFTRADKQCNLALKNFSLKISRDELPSFLASTHQQMEFVFHIGARTDTTLFDREIFERLNLEYSKNVWDQCVKYEIPLVYASSAATYGTGEHGYDDDHSLVNKLQPLNPYAESKHEFDKWVLSQKKEPPFWAGLKFFNVYGPNEYHKGRMASVVYHAYRQIKETGKVKLFRSHNPEFEDGGQLRDFIYVKDVADICIFMMRHKPESGIYNVGTGKARTFSELVKAVFDVLEMPVNIEYIDTPADIRDKYQYFTEAKIGKLTGRAEYHADFWSLEEGVRDYIDNFLTEGTCY